MTDRVDALILEFVQENTRWAVDGPQYRRLRQLTDQAVATAVAAERKACLAKAVAVQRESQKQIDEINLKFPPQKYSDERNYAWGKKNGAEKIAAAIRARGGGE